MSQCFQLAGPPKDVAYTNVGSRNLLACNSASKSYVNALFTSMNPEIIYLTEDPVANATYDLGTPDNRKTIYTFTAPLTTNETITFTLDSSQSQMGDEMVWLFQNSSHLDITINTPDGNPFYVFQCADLTSSITLNAANSGPPSIPGRLAQYFVFDGDVWVYTGDNC